MFWGLSASTMAEADRLLENMTRNFAHNGYASIATSGCATKASPSSAPAPRGCGDVRRVQPAQCFLECVVEVVRFCANESAY